MKLHELRSWCNRAQFADDKEVVFITPDYYECKLEELTITKDQVIMRGN